MVEILYKDESYRVIGACYEVHRVMGAGFLEAVYQECLGIEFADRGIVAVPRRQLRLSYKHHLLESIYIPDFLCFGKIILEIKGISDLNHDHRAQVLNYLKATGCRVGLLVNFGRQAGLQWERLVF